MGELLTGPTFWRMFSGVRFAQRLETRDHYAGDEQLFARWRRGELDSVGLAKQISGWLDVVRAVRRAGGRFERVRVVGRPPTDYQRFARSTVSVSAGAGEDIRYLDVEHAQQIDLPTHDFWLLNGERLALLYFTADNRLIGAQYVSDETVVRQHQHWFDSAFAAATACRTE